jgi:TolA-binding protein
MVKKSLLLSLLFVSGWALVFAQNTSQREHLKAGINFYREGKFTEAADRLQRAGPVPEALYWLSLAELSSGNYNDAMVTMEILKKTDPGGRWSAEVPYHQGRCLYHLGRHDEAIARLKGFADTLASSDPRRGSAYYWMGESLLAQEQLDRAAEAFSLVVENYPYSVKYEASAYRLSLIRQKKAETELLSILKWSHEESLKSQESYQELEKTYDQTIAAYQQRLDELLAESEMAAAEKAATEDRYRSRLSAAEMHITALEASLAEANAILLELRRGGVTGRPLTARERSLKILELKAAVSELSTILTQKLNEERR